MPSAAERDVYPAETHLSSIWHNEREAGGRHPREAMVKMDTGCARLGQMQSQLMVVGNDHRGTHTTFYSNKVFPKIGDYG